MSEKLSIATAAGRHSVVWKNRKVTWEQMVKKCSETTRTAETVAEYRRMDKNRQSEVKDVGGFVGGFLREGRRKKGHVELRSMATLPAGRRVAILGNMGELGANADALHRETGVCAAEAGVSLVITCGELAKNIAVGAAAAITVRGRRGGTRRRHARHGPRDV